MTMGGRTFCAAAPDLWNALADKLRNASFVESFKSGLKTLYNAMAFPSPFDPLYTPLSPTSAPFPFAVLFPFPFCLSPD